MKYSQKYTIAQLFEPLADGTEYSWTDWPPHVTIADVFAIDLEGTDFIQKLSRLLADQKPFSSDADHDELFGPQRNIRVTLLQKTPELAALHEQVVALLEANGATFNNPQFTREGYMPHVTVQKNTHLKPGESVRFHALTLIDMFPDNDHEKRRVLGTYFFSS